MIELKRYKFSELYEMSSGISTKPEQAGKGYPFISFSTIFNNYFIPFELPDLMDSSDEDRIKYSVKEGDIFLTRTSETVDELGMSSVVIKDIPNATFSGFSKRLRPTQSGITYHKFMAFYLRSKLFRKTMTNNALMTLRASLNEQIFSYLELLLPDYNTQKKIGDLLYIINSKIELNNKLNRELENLAIEYFNYWFIQFDFPDKKGNPYKASGGKMVFNQELKREIPEIWKVKRFDYFNLYQPKTISEKEMIKDGKYLVFGANGIVGNYDKYNHKESEITITCRGNSCGTINRTIPYSWITGNAMVVKSLVEEVKTEFIYHTIKWSGVERIISGSGQPQITRTNLETVKFVLPDFETLKKFNNLIDNNVEKRLNIFKENQKLAELRDWLLPMLINGQVKFKEAQDHINQAAEPQEVYQKNA